MKESDQYEVIIGLEDSSDPAEVVIEEDDVDCEHISDENDLPAGWEDLLYDTWHERQLEKKLEKQLKRIR